MKKTILSMLLMLVFSSVTVTFADDDGHSPIGDKNNNCNGAPSCLMSGETRTTKEDYSVIQIIEDCWTLIF